MITTPSLRLMDALRANPGATDVLAAIDHYLSIYGHMGYTLDFVEPPQVEDPAGFPYTHENKEDTVRLGNA